MAEHIWSILCYKGVIDKATNQVSLLDVMEQIQLSKVPTDEERDKGLSLGVNLNLVSYWVRSEQDIAEKIEARIILRGPTGKEFSPIQLKVDLNESFGHRHVLNFDRLPYDGLGYYWFLIQKKNNNDEWVSVSSIPLELLEMKV